MVGNTVLAESGVKLIIVGLRVKVECQVESVAVVNGCGW